jgi:eukaryotic-like serine/threonine-protein kinase
MDRGQWKRLEALIDQALELEGTERQALLERLATDDPPLGAELSAFLSAQALTGDFLEAPVDDHAGALLVAFGASDPSWGDGLAAGHRIGPYRLLAVLGRGGMGTVFLAERADGQFEQQVALKLVKRGMETLEIVERFRTERQILARLQHPNIARLLDGGASEDGQPYFAMERVLGTPLTLHCDRSRLTIDDRLRLFLQVCDAVDYAHRNLVVHRDLKPSNVLVTAEGVPKLLDFGIAKVLDPSDEDGSMTMTRPEARPRTLAYAAPEQLLGQPVTTATDVYALGVILYEILAGRRPVAPEGDDRAEIERVLQQRERQPPSAAVRGVVENGPRAAEDGLAAAEGAPSAEEIAAARGTSVDRLQRRLAGDLDNAVGMALRFEPERRYPSARALADDLRRFLDGRPVAARADTFAYRASKFVRRHRLVLAGAMLLALSLLGGIVGTAWQARRALRQARQAQEVKQFVFGVFGQSDPNAAKGQEITARQLLAEGARRIQSELADQPEVEAEMLLFVGQIDYRLGLAPEARPLFTRALELRRRLFGEDSAGVADAEVALATVLFWQGELKEADTLLVGAVEKRRKWKGQDHPDTAYARGLLGRVRLERGDMAGAETLLRAAVADERRHLSSPHVELASNINALGRVAQAKGDLDEAERLYREALDMRQKLFGEEHTRVSESQLNLASVMRDRGDDRGALPWFRKVLDLDRRLLGDTHDKIASDLNNLGQALLATGQYPEAEERLRESLEVRRRLYGADSPKTAIGLHGLARALRHRGKLEEAESLSRRALGLAVTLLGDDHANVGSVREELALIRCAQGQLGEAEALARRALQAYRQKLPADHPWVAGGQVTLAHVLVAAHRAAEAEPLLVDALERRRRKLGDGNPRTAEARLALAECLADLRPAEAEAPLAAARAVLGETLGAEHPLALRADRLARRLSGAPTARAAR